MTSLIQPKMHRKMIVPWYDSGKAIVFSILLLMFILAFGVVGMIVAQENTQYKSFFGMPLSIVLMSGYAFLSMVVRLLIRRSKVSKEGLAADTIIQ